MRGSPDSGLPQEIRNTLEIAGVRTAKKVVKGQHRVRFTAAKRGFQLDHWFAAETCNSLKGDDEEISHSLRHESASKELARVLVFNFGSTLQHPEQVAKAHEQGKFVFVYTVNDEESMRKLAELGIDGMVSDRPSLLLKVLGEGR